MTKPEHAHLYTRIAAARDLAWHEQHCIRGDWEPAEEPRTDAEQWWYEQGRAEAYASIMTILEQL